jgi:hypothetical protein
LFEIKETGLKSSRKTGGTHYIVECQRTNI